MDNPNDHETTQLTLTAAQLRTLAAALLDTCDRARQDAHVWAERLPLAVEEGDAEAIAHCEEGDRIAEAQIERASAVYTLITRAGYDLHCRISRARFPHLYPSA